MKLVLEITGLQSGKSEKEDNPYSWTNLTGRTTKGAYCFAKAYDDTAKALAREIVKHTPRGEEVGTTRIVVEMTGEWRDSKPYKRASDGKTVTSRHFRIATFDILTGPQLELARLKRDVADKLTLAEELRQAGRMGIAYRTIAEFAAVICNRELDLNDIADSDEADEVVYGEPDMSDPEAAAAARFASMDGIAEPMSIARKEQSPPADEAVAASPEETADEAEPTEADETDETHEAEADERDVLDDDEAPEADAPEPAPVRDAAAAHKPAVPGPRPAAAPTSAPVTSHASAAPAPAPRRPVPPAPGRVPPPPRI